MVPGTELVDEINSSVTLLYNCNCYNTVLSGNTYMANAGVGAGAKLRDKDGAGAENKQFRLRKLLFSLHTDFTSPVGSTPNVSRKLVSFTRPSVV